MCPLSSVTALGYVLLAGSGVTSNRGIGWGGTDEDGTKEPSVRRRDIFSEEEYE